MLRKTLSVSVLVFAIAAATPASAQPSFDCGRASLANEILICNSSDLATLDRELAQLYGDLRNGMSGWALDNLKATQRQWLKQRNRCAGNYTCTQNLYQHRIDVLFQEFNALGN